MKPSIVFNRLSKCWKQRKCGDVFTESREFGHSGDVAKKLTVKLWGKGVYAKLDQGSANTHYFIRHTGQFIYSKLDFLNSAFGVVNEALDGYESTADMPAFDCHGVNPYFMYYRAIQPSFYITNGMIADGSRKAKRVHAETFLQMPLMLPSIEEQDKIAWFFRKLEDTITIHQRKINSMKRLKKSLLQKMFPQNGECVPEIRFSGFTDSWEQRKLESLCIKFTDGDWIEAKDQSDSGVRLVQTGNVGVTEYLDKPNNKKWISEETFNRLHCEEVLPGDILISRLPEPAGRACIMPALETKMITAVDCTIVRTAPEINNKFLVQYLSSQSYFKEVNTCLAGGTRQRISRSNLANFDIPVPTDKAEQDAIGEFLDNLDNLITLHQRKALQLQKIKQALLQHMFI